MYVDGATLFIIEAQYNLLWIESTIYTDFLMYSWRGLGGWFVISNGRVDREMFLRELIPWC